MTVIDHKLIHITKKMKKNTLEHLEALFWNGSKPGNTFRVL